MVKRAFQKSFSIFMAILLLCSTISFTIQKHFCGNELIDVAMFSKVDNCGMDMDTMMASIEKKHCCKEEIVIIKGQDKLKTTSFEDWHFDPQIVLASFVYSSINPFEGLPKRVSPHKDYSPPNLFADRQILHQVFII